MTIGKTWQSSERKLTRFVFFLRPAVRLLEEDEEDAVAPCNDPVAELSPAPLLSSERLTSASLSGLFDLASRREAGLGCPRLL